VDKKIIRTDKAPAPVGPYSQATVFGELVFTAGQIGLAPGTKRFAGGDVGSQTRQALENLKAVLEEAGSGLNKVLKTTVFLKDMGDFPAMNDAYAECFSESSPARSAIEAARLPLDALVEIECVAHR
jgi:2-iminobutanoate/2-iminopropanoate deaminase